MSPASPERGGAAPAIARVEPARTLWGAMLAVGLIWGMAQFLMKVGMAGPISPVSASAWQAVIGAAVAFAALRLSGRGLPLTPRHILFYGVCGLLGTAIPAVASFAAIRHLPVGIQSIAVATVPMLTLAMALPLGIERAEIRRLLGLALGFVAIVLLVGPKSSLPEEGQLFWLLIALVSPLCYATENIVIARYQPADIGPIETGCGLLLAATLILLPVGFLAGDLRLPGAAPATDLALIGVALCNIVSYLGFVWLITRAGPVFTAQVGYVVTGTGVLAGVVFLGESHALTVWLSLTALFGGIALVSPRPLRA
ncbi:MAG: DMT family transporter [Pseudomonadota bacterium]